MIYLIISAVLILAAVFVLVCVNFNRTKKNHQARLDEMKNVIISMSFQKDKESVRLQLSDEINDKLIASRFELDKGLLDIQHDCFEELAKRNQGNSDPNID
jgi:signal transduction histidine kinase